MRVRLTLEKKNAFNKYPPPPSEIKTNKKQYKQQQKRVPLIYLIPVSGGSPAYISAPKMARDSRPNYYQCYNKQNGGSHILILKA